MVRDAEWLEEGRVADLPFGRIDAAAARALLEYEPDAEVSALHRARRG